MRTRLLVGTAASAAAVAVVTGLVFALDPIAPVLSLGVLYLLAVVPVAAVWGLRFGVGVSLVSMLVFNWLFLPPKHTLHLAESEDWVALTVYLVVAVSVSALAARARSRTAESEQRRREASFAADVSGLLLGASPIESELPEIAVRTADLLGVSHCWIELGTPREPDANETSRDLVAGDRFVGRVFFDVERALDEALTQRLLGVLSSLLATAVEREELSRSDETKTTVLRSVSHDLRSPLTAIATAAEMLAEPGELLSDDDRTELLASIREQSRRLDRLVGNLLDLSRLEAGAAQPLAELWPVDELIGRALDALGSGGDRVVVSLAPDCPAVRVDAAQLERVLVNLVENALRYSSPADRVEVRAAADAADVVISVVDCGPGLDADEQESIFEPFSHGPGAGGRGTGLGLAIARGFTTLNGGRLWVESTPGRGATFSVALPVVEVDTQVPV